MSFGAVFKAKKMASANVLRDDDTQDLLPKTIANPFAIDATDNKRTRRRGHWWKRNA